jgi:hypothetical protein
MGKRDYRWRERRKPKKGAKRTSKSEILPTPPIVEVVKKRKKTEAEEAEE